jgi:osmotically-inducible protein OsmY
MGSLPLIFCVTTIGCSSGPKFADLKTPVHNAITQAGFKDVSVDQDRDKGVITLTGHVASDADKSTAESLARANAPGEIIADQIAVLPPGDESTAKDINSDLDKAIAKNLDAAMLQSNLRDESKKIKYDIKNGVVTLKGQVDSSAKRSELQVLAAAVPNVTQVVNEVQLKDIPATTNR